MNYIDELAVRILVLSSDYPPNAGGIARLSWASAAALRRRGHEVLVLATTSDFEQARAFDAAQPFATRRVTSTLALRELALYFATRKAARDFRPDVVWSALWFPCAWLASYVPELKRTIQVVSTYGSEVLPNTRAGVKQWLKAQLEPLRQRVFLRADWIFTLSRYTRGQVLALGAPETKLEVLPGGVDEHWFDIAALPKQPERPVLLTVARLDEHKGHDVILRSLTRVRKEIPGIRYRMVGPSAGNWERLERLAGELGVRDCVDYLGRVKEQELYREYAAADVFIMLSREIPGRHVEGFGLTFLEAAALGVPSVAGNSGGVPDAVEDGTSGILVDPLSVDQTSAAILSLLRDRELLERMGKHARDRALRHFSWDSVAARMSSRFEVLRQQKEELCLT